MDYNKIDLTELINNNSLYDFKINGFFNENEFDEILVEEGDMPGIYQYKKEDFLFIHNHGNKINTIIIDLSYYDNYYLYFNFKNGIIKLLDSTPFDEIINDLNCFNIPFIIHSDGILGNQDNSFFLKINNVNFFFAGKTKKINKIYLE